MLNRNTTAAVETTLPFAACANATKSIAMEVVDLWTGEKLGSFKGSFTATVKPHAHIMVKLIPKEEELSTAAAAAPLPTGPYNTSCSQCGCVGAFQWDLQCDCLNLERQVHETVLKQACNLSGQYACKPGSINNQDGTLVCQRKPPQE